MRCKLCDAEMNSCLSISSAAPDPKWGEVIHWCDAQNCDYEFKEQDVDVWAIKYPLKNTGVRLNITLTKDFISFTRQYVYSGKGIPTSQARIYKATKERVWRILQYSSVYHHYTA